MDDAELPAHPARGRVGTRTDAARIPVGRRPAAPVPGRRTVDQRGARLLLSRRLPDLLSARLEQSGQIAGGDPGQPYGRAAVEDGGDPAPVRDEPDDPVPGQPALPEHRPD